MAMFEFVDLSGLNVFKQEFEKETAHDFANRMTIEQNATTGVLTFKLYSKDNTLLDTKTIDLDTEHIIKSVDLDYAQKELIFTMNDDSTIVCDISDLIDTLSLNIQNVADDLTSEIQRATTKEGQLETAIGNEATTRGTEITRVEGLINAESSARSQAISDLENNIENANIDLISNVDLEEIFPNLESESD